MKKNDEIQIIGLDCGRGYTKGYTKVNGVVKECCFKSIIGEGRSIELTGYKNPIMIQDSKVSETVQILVAAALSSLAIEDNVKIMMAVPYKAFRKTILSEIIETYKGKTVKVKDMVNGGYKEVRISDISICREADAALYWELKDRDLVDKPVGIANIGFRSTELTYFDKDLMFIDKKSDTIEFGNGSIMNNVKDKLLNEGIIKTVNEIDSSNDYDELKYKAYKIAAENIEQTIEEKWVNLDEMEIYIAGGTALNMKFEDRFKIIDDAQMATAKGCWIVGTQRF